ncbi:MULTISPECIES: thyroid transcription factor 1-associated protein 26 [unclassified Rhizobium]|uniref:hypothetical protein n=1 Tax=unclassified Rhizobium TaxID=2613769 RepID=UPI001ADB1126|nr:MULTISPECIES: hypothetical protein [unclassified Rhizobium]MBO9122787.1 hypothetical protein [Rhizobium sp. 16-488-2b]MBO9173319.1 hypothetical protein [Rhizobium sp. 16-488-2a]
MKQASRDQVEIKHRSRRKAMSSGQTMLGNCILGTVNRPRTWKLSLSLVRLREIELVIKDRHGGIIPDPNGTDDVDLCLGYIRAVAHSAPEQDLKDWCARFAPWAVDRWLEVGKPILEETVKRKKMLSADAVAALMNVTLAERTTLGLKTIGSCDVTASERKEIARERKRELDRARQEQKRSAEKRKDRKSYEAHSLAKLKPWAAAGISRATWYRKQNETGLSPLLLITTGDTLVSQADLPPTPPRIQVRQARAAGMVGGLGHHAPAGLQGAEPHGIGDTLKDRVA